MQAKPKAVKAPKLFITTGADALTLRKKLSLNQSDFWSRVAIGQSGGSRYESGRRLPRPVQLLLHLAYAPEVQAGTVLAYLRKQD
jgi:DNA-binding transcriptional regulator YiaG